MVGLPNPGMKIDRERTALVITEPQNERIPASVI